MQRERVREHEQRIMQQEARQAEESRRQRERVSEHEQRIKEQEAQIARLDRMLKDLLNAQDAYVGLDISSRPPFVVQGVSDMMDTNHVMQGRAGYNNEIVRPGDRLMQIDRHAVTSTTTIQTVHQLLSGQLHTPVELHFMRNDGPGQKLFSVRVLRHLSHNG